MLGLMVLAMLGASGSSSESSQAAPAPAPATQISTPAQQEEWLVGACAQAVTLFLAGSNPQQREMDCFGKALDSARLLSSTNLNLPAQKYQGTVQFDDLASPLNYQISLRLEGQEVGRLINRNTDVFLNPTRYYLDRQSLPLNLNADDEAALAWGAVCLGSFTYLVLKAKVILRSFGMECQNSTLDLAFKNRFPAIAGKELDIEALALTFVSPRQEKGMKLTGTAVNVHSKSGRWFTLQWLRDGASKEFSLPRVQEGQTPLE